MFGSANCITRVGLDPLNDNSLITELVQAGDGLAPGSLNETGRRQSRQP
jgi:hypothetical protein